MDIFRGRYSWDGKKHDNRDPIAWFPGAYDLVISRVAEASQSVSYIYPYICIFTNTGSGHSVSSNPESFAKHICEDFSLPIERVLWVEQLQPGSEQFDVIVFKKERQMAETVFYSIDKRKPSGNEQRMILRHLQGGGANGESYGHVRRG